MLFARRVAFVEGETEASLFPFLAEKIGCFEPEVSVIGCGSKFNLPLYIELAQAFGLNFVVVYDEDPVSPELEVRVEELGRYPDANEAELQREKDKLKSAKRTFKVNQEIADLVLDPARLEMVSPDIEGVAGVSRGLGKKLGKPLAAVEHFDDAEVTIPERLEEIVRAVYAGGDPRVPTRSVENAR